MLVVEDEPKMAALVARALREEGHPADVAGRGRRCALDGAGRAVRRDRARRDAAGLRRLRGPARAAPARGLDAGADAHRARRGRPTASARSTREPTTTSRSRSRSPSCSRVCARSRAAGRSTGRRRCSSATSGSTRPTRRVWRGDTEIELSTREFALLELFMRRPGQALSRLQLLEGAWDMAFESRSNIVDVYVRYLREKIDRPFGRASIETVRGRRLPPPEGRPVRAAADPRAPDAPVRPRRWRSCSRGWASSSTCASAARSSRPSTRT